MTLPLGPDGEGEPSRSYLVAISDTADKEADDIYLWIGKTVSPARAQRWYEGLLTAYDRLRVFPYQWQATPEYGPGVRRMLYERYRVLYLVIEPSAEEETVTPGIIRILHVYHGARRQGNDATDNSEAEQ